MGVVFLRVDRGSEALALWLSSKIYFQRLETSIGGARASGLAMPGTSPTYLRLRKQVIAEMRLDRNYCRATSIKRQPAGGVPSRVHSGIVIAAGSCLTRLSSRSRRLNRDLGGERRTPTRVGPLLGLGEKFRYGFYHLAKLGFLKEERCGARSSCRNCGLGSADLMY